MTGDRPAAGRDAPVADYTRRTILANERTYLAWWRTGLTTLTVALGAARVVPELSKTSTQWPYTLLGAGFAVLGIGCVVYAERRHKAVDRAIRAGDSLQQNSAVTLGLTAAGVLLGLGLLVIVLTAP